MIGNAMCDGRCWSTKTVFSAVWTRVCRPIGSPMLGFTSKRGKLLLEMSTHR